MLVPFAFWNVIERLEKYQRLRVSKRDYALVALGKFAFEGSNFAGGCCITTYCGGLLAYPSMRNCEAIGM
jgi:hypothetical protein